MNKKIKLPVIFCILTVLLAGVCTAYAAATVQSESKVTNSVQTSVVDISLTQSYMDMSGQRVEGTDTRELMPGAEISLIPTLTNEGTDCYIRVKLSSAVFQNGELSDLEAPFSITDIYGASDDWMIAGEYLYYTKSLEHGESIDIFNGIRVPDNMGNIYMGKSIVLDIVAEAVQRDFFLPDFESSSPWSELSAETCIYEGYQFESLRTSQETECTVHFEGGANGIVIFPDDFFAQFSAMVPGGIYTGTAEVSNTSDDTVSIFFRTEVLENENELLEQLSLQIVQIAEDNTETVLYEGSYNSEDLQNYILLGTYENDESCLLRYTIAVPEEMDNAYSLANGAIDWYFMAEYETVQETEQTDILTTENVAVESSDVGITTYSGSAAAAKTGDHAFPGIYLATVLLMCIFMTACIIVSCRKKAKKEERHVKDRR